MSFNVNGRMHTDRYIFLKKWIENCRGRTARCCPSKNCASVSFLSKISEVLAVNCLIKVITFASSLRLSHGYTASLFQRFRLGRGRGIRPTAVKWRQNPQARTRHYRVAMHAPLLKSLLKIK